MLLCISSFFSRLCELANMTVSLMLRLHCSVSSPNCPSFTVALSKPNEIRQQRAIGQCWVQWGDDGWTLANLKSVIRLLPVRSSVNKCKRKGVCKMWWLFTTKANQQAHLWEGHIMILEPRSRSCLFTAQHSEHNHTAHRQRSHRQPIDNPVCRGCTIERCSNLSVKTASDLCGSGPCCKASSCQWHRW